MNTTLIVTYLLSVRTCFALEHNYVSSTRHGTLLYCSPHLKPKRLAGANGRWEIHKHFNLRICGDPSTTITATNHPTDLRAKNQDA